MKQDQKNLNFLLGGCEAGEERMSLGTVAPQGHKCPGLGTAAAKTLPTLGRRV